MVLSFTNSSALEMSDRIKKETGKRIDAMTFHKIGKEIIASVEGRQPSVAIGGDTSSRFMTILLTLFIVINRKKCPPQEQCLNKLIKQPEYQRLLSSYILSYAKEYTREFDFGSIGEHNNYLSDNLKDNKIITLNGEVVKSYEEMEIANFLYMNNIKYEYEPRYEYDTATSQHSQYRPDFYLTDYKIYIEHFGIDRDGNVPAFFTGSNRQTAKELYNEGIVWKRQLHKDNNTRLIETYSYEKTEGVLLEELGKKLVSAGVEVNPMTEDELWKEIEKDSAFNLNSFCKLVVDFINLLKTNNYSIEAVKAKNNNCSGVQRLVNYIFTNLIEPIYESYQNQLENDNEIDFGDASSA